MRFVRRFALVLLACLVVPATVAAQPDQVISLTRCLNGGSWTVNANDPVIAQISWGTLTESQQTKFLGSQSGSYTLIDATNSVSGVAWSVGDTRFWGLPFQASIQGKPGWLSTMRLPLGALGIGIHFLTVNAAVDKTVFDGISAVQAGTWLSVTCRINVI
jgi:hypothetical protein